MLAPVEDPERLGRAGAHDLVAGVDRFQEERYANNHQSGSDFSLFVTRVQTAGGVRALARFNVNLQVVLKRR